MQSYGLIISLSLLIALWVCFIEVNRKKENKEILLDLFFWCVLAGVAGARLYHIINFWQFYINQPFLIAAVWKGGLGIYGAIVGGILALVIYCWYHKLNFWRWLDITALGLPLGQAIGRWANWFNQELYGKPTNLPWAIYIKPENRLAGWEKYSFFHPLFLYESLWCFFIFLIILFLARQKKIKLFKGELFLIYLILYALGRFWLEFLRIDNWKIGKLPTAQIISLCLILTSIVIIFLKRKIIPLLYHYLYRRRRNRNFYT